MYLKYTSYQKYAFVLRQLRVASEEETLLDSVTMVMIGGDSLFLSTQDGRSIQTSLGKAICRIGNSSAALTREIFMRNWWATFSWFKKKSSRKEAPIHDNELTGIGETANFKRNALNTGIMQSVSTIGWRRIVKKALGVTWASTAPIWRSWNINRARSRCDYRSSKKWS